MSAPALTAYQNGVNQVSGDQLNTFASWCVNVAQLRGFIGLSNMLVYIEGYTSAGDGGQGFFYWNSTGTTPDDSGLTTIVPNGAASGEWTRLGAAGLTLSNLTVTGNTTLNNLTFSSTLGIIGSTTNDNAAAGSVGEYISSVVATGSAVAITSGVGANVTQISLTVGDWDVSGVIAFKPAGSTVTTLADAAISTTSASLLSPSTTTGTAGWVGSVTGVGPTVATGNARLSLASATIVYLVAQSNFTTSTSAAYGYIGARRVR